MRRGLSGIGAAVAALVMCSCPSAANAAAPAASTWTVQPTPLPAGAAGGDLNGVSCTAAASCIAVGESTTVSDTNQLLAESWDGSAWKVQATPSPAGAVTSDLNAISCVSASSCIAVGKYFTSSDVFGQAFAESWNGSSWTVQAVPQPAGADGSDLMGVSCTSAARCIAVGWWSQPAGSNHLRPTLAESWNGSAWTIQASPPIARTLFSPLDGVSCVSATNCTAVGDHQPRPANGMAFTLAEHWDGSTWTIQTTADVAGQPDNLLLGVSCTSAASCNAVGAYDTNSGTQQTLAEHWDGSTWTIQASADPFPSMNEHSLTGVSCVSVSSCTAAATYGVNNPVRAGIQYWPGSTWTARAAAAPALGSLLNAISCVSAHVCTAVGATAPPDNGTFQPLAEQE